MRILVDTNVLVRLVHVDSSLQDVARRALKLFEDNDDEICLVPQVIYEYWAVVTRPVDRNGLGFSCELAYAQIQELKIFFHLLRDERSIYEPWEQLVQKHQVIGKQAHDARLVAAMQRHGLTHILTFNVADFSRYSNIQVLNPQQVVATS